MSKRLVLDLLWGVTAILSSALFSSGNSSHVVYSVNSDGTIGGADFPDTNYLSFQSDPKPVFTCNRININTADNDSLILLPGIGPSLAKSILEFRKEAGQIKGLEDLEKVKGIGPAKIERLKRKICF